MRNIPALKKSIAVIVDYIYKRGEKAIAKYHQRFAEIGLEAIATMGKPVAVMLTFWPGAEYKDTPPSEILEELKRYFREHPCVNSRHEITVQWVRELREPTPGRNGNPGIPGGWHYHVMVVMDFSKVSIKYLKNVALWGMKLDGYFHKYWLSRVGGSHDKDDPVQEHHLLNPEGWAEYLKHAEYPAKLRTKVKTKDRRNTGGSQVTRMPEWLTQFFPVDMPTGGVAI